MKKILVHGVHRSGTSLTASLLNELGLWYSEEKYKMAPQKDNPKGFWERKDVTELNDAILAQMDLSWFTLTPRLDESRFISIQKHFSEELKNIAARIDKRGDWFLKDPRFAMTWPIWRKYIEPSNHIFVYRNPMQVADSLNRRNGISLDHGIIFWYHQTRILCGYLAGESKVHAIEFGTRSLFESSFYKAVDSIYSDAEGAISKRIDMDSIFESNLVTSQNDDPELLERYPVIGEAWDYLRVGSYEKIANLPIIETNCFDWRSLESRYSVSSQFSQLDNELRQLKKEIASLHSNNSELHDKNSELHDKNSELHVVIQDQQSRHKAEQQADREANLRKEKRWEREAETLKSEILAHVSQIEEGKSEIDALTARVKILNEESDELKLSLLKIKQYLETYYYSKRYTLLMMFDRIFFKLRLINNRSITPAIDIAKFGHSNEQLEKYSPNVSSRTLLLRAILRSPITFLKKLTVKRVAKAIRIFFNKELKDENVNLALHQYTSVDIANDGSLKIYDPDKTDGWSDQVIEFEEQENPLVSIVIPVFNNYFMTLSCLLSIAKCTNLSLKLEVIVADDCSTDQTVNIKDKVKGVQVVKGEENVGFLMNCNNAVSVARGEYIVLLNNDTNVQEGWLDELIRPHMGDDNVAVTGPMFVYPDGRLQEAGGIIFSDASGWNYGRLDSPEKPQYKFSRDVDYVSGACLVFKKQFWMDLGGFDTRFTPAYYEDTDFCFSARKLGYKVRYIATSTVVHFEGVSHGTGENTGIKKYQSINKKKFEKKWRSVLAKEHYPSADNLFLARSHGKSKKTVLFIDHYVPFYDKDAGSKVAQRYIELMIEEGINVIFLGDNFYPHQPYTRELEEIGVEVLYGEFYKDNWYEWYEENCKYIDAVYLNRPHISSQYIDKIKNVENVPHIAYHGADLHYVRVERESALGIESGDGVSSSEWKAIEYDLMRKSDVSLWLSENEVNLVKSEDPSINVAYKPMYWFDDADFESERKVEQSPNLLFVGGFGHPPNLDGLCWFLEEVYPLVLESVSNVKLTIIGSNCPNEIISLECKNIHIAGFVSESELIQTYKDTRVSIVPLRYGAGVKGKVIESMKYGVPVMTTKIGAEGLPGDSDSYLSTSDDSKLFARDLIELLMNDDLCEEKIKSSDATLKTHFSRSFAVEALKKIVSN